VSCFCAKRKTSCSVLSHGYNLESSPFSYRRYEKCTSEYQISQRIWDIPEQSLSIIFWVPCGKTSSALNLHPKALFGQLERVVGGKATNRISCYVNEPQFIIDHPSNIGQHSAKIRSEETGNQVYNWLQKRLKKGNIIVLHVRTAQKYISVLWQRR